MKHTIISGIDKLAVDSEQVLTSVSTVAYLNIQSESQLIEAFKNCDVFWFRLNHKITQKVVENTRCKFIVCAATGLDHIDLAACNAKGITIISLKGESEFLKEVRATAEHTLGLLLTLIRKSKKAFQHVEQGKWDRTQFQGSELYKKKVGILGMGRLGKIMADYYSVMGMQVSYYDIEDQHVNENFSRVHAVNDFLKEIDVLSIHLPYNTDTHKNSKKLTNKHTDNTDTQTHIQ
jgi:D-3-phosphoglycerate dehydrogenase